VKRWPERAAASGCEGRLDERMREKELERERERVEGSGGGGVGRVPK